jgi:hypothetical protein
MNNRLTDQKRRDEETKRQTDKRNKLAGEERRLKDMQKASLLEVHSITHKFTCEEIFLQKIY